MKPEYLLSSRTGKNLYFQVKDLPIVDYHCHLPPKEIYEDKPYDNIGEMWLGGDHYKWRLMRANGIDEEYITGSASWHDKFVKYAQAVEFAAGSPLYYWTKMELAKYFGIDQQLTPASAESIWERANARIRQEKISPRKLILSSNVEFIATTDDIADSLEWHEKIAADESFPVRVAPSFRCDNLILIRREGYADYVKKLADVCGFAITDMASLKKAITTRLDFFKVHGCIFTDVGVEFFPNAIGSEECADKTFRAALAGEEVSDNAYLAFLGHMYVFLAQEYKKRDLIMQWHLAVKRNANSVLHKKLGLDVGVDCINDAIPANDIIRILDAINSSTGLPKTVLYTLNPAMATQLSTIAGCFPNVIMGTSWWFCDHVRGIAEQIKVIAETAYLGSFLGMLTDSRSFLSYARHDFFRRILCQVIGEWVDNGEFAASSALELTKNICCGNVEKLIGR